MLHTMSAECTRLRCILDSRAAHMGQGRLQGHRSWWIVSAIIAFQLAFSTASAGTPVPLTISGFGDFYFVTPQDSGISGPFQIGQAEVDLSAELGRSVDVNAAIAYDPSSQSFQLGAFFADLHLFGSSGSHFTPVKGIDHSGIIVGKFDVPFGIDWHVYASVDRKLVSRPLMVEMTHGGWNDYGAQIYVATHGIEATVYGTNGFAYRALDLIASDENDSVEVVMKDAVGTHISIKPLPELEIGSSYAGFFNRQDRFDMSLWGTDLQLELGNFAFRGEFVQHSIRLAEGLPGRNRGVYGEAEYDFGAFFLVDRFDRFWPADHKPSVSRASLGAGARILTGYELRGEYQITLGPSEDAAYIQVAMRF